MAVVGLVYAGQKFSRDSDDGSAPTAPKVIREPRDHAMDFMDTKNVTPDVGRRVGSERMQPKREIASLQDSNQVQFPFGQPVYDLVGRENISNRMHNVPPVTKVIIGPGLGVGANVASAGGFQQLFRVLPTNINDERLIPLKGNMGGPADAVVKGAPAVTGDLTHFPEKVYYRPPAQTSGQGQGGALHGTNWISEYVKTARTTTRQETGDRQGDFLQFGTMQSTVYQPYGNDHSLMKDRGTKQNPDRAGNGQMMNVRADPLDAGGLVTNLRREYDTDAPGPPGPGVGLVQNYRNDGFYDLNELKSNKNPYATNESLNMAKDVNAGNYVALSIN